MIFVKSDDLGNIIEVIERTSDCHLSEGLANITDQPNARQVANAPHKYRMVDGKCLEKPRVDLRPDKLVIKANGEDRSKVVAVTSYHRPIKLKVGRLDHEVAPNGDFEISSDAVGVIMVKIDDPNVWGPSISIFVEPYYESTIN